MRELIDKLKANIETERAMFAEMSKYSLMTAGAPENERGLYESAVESLRKNIAIINSSIPRILNNITLAKELPAKSTTRIKSTGLEEVSYTGPVSRIKVALSKEDKEKFLRELSFSDSIIRKIKKGELAGKQVKPGEFKSSRGYLKLSNKYFLEKSIGIIKKGYFMDLATNLKKGNFEVLLETYVAMMLFTTVISVFAGILIMIFFMFFNVEIVFPFFSAYSGSYISRFFEVFWIIFAVPLATFASIYFYPSTEKSSISKRIDQEIPFAVIHMNAVSGSGIAPVEIFKIIGLSPEYPYLRKEIIKVLNQINLYGYDLSTALSNVAKNSSNQRLSELFSGLATTINSGGSLNEFFEKRAETLMVQYKLEREGFSKMAETFMDIYISVVIATPMILMLLLMMISVTGANIGLSPSEIGLIIIGVLALLNVFFLFFLNIKQPSY